MPARTMRVFKRKRRSQSVIRAHLFLPSESLPSRSIANGSPVFVASGASVPLRSLGRVLRDDFDPKRSDVDVLAEFAPGVLRRVGLRYFDFAEELDAILGHRVDFSSQLHPMLRERVSREAVKLSEQV
jgi:predicted nucleotidyltransferase